MLGCLVKMISVRLLNWKRWAAIFLSSFSLFAQTPLSVCAIFKNEASFLKEWIEFHKLQGVSRFFLYNNNSEDHYLEVLAPYIQSQEVVLVEWPYKYGQGQSSEWISIHKRAYMDCIQKYGLSTAWLAFIDIDEFLFCPTGDLLPEFLSKYSNYGAVCANWRLFGTSDVDCIPPGKLMIELLTECCPLNHKLNKRIKSIVQPQYVVGCINPHLFSHRPPFYSVNADFQMISNIFTNPFVCYDKIRINHYWTRTKQDFFYRKIPSRHERRSHENEESLLRRAAEYKGDVDTAIFQFIPALRRQMGY